MSVIRIDKTRDYTVMSNHHFRNRDMSLKAKGLLSMMLSLPDEWDYSVKGLVMLNKDGTDSINSAIKELEQFGYIKREQAYDDKGRFCGYDYTVYEYPLAETPLAENPLTGNPAQLNTKESNTKKSNTKELNNKETVTSIIEEAPAELQENLNDFIEMRKKNKSAMTVKAIKLLISKLDKLSGGDIAVSNAILEQSIINGWKSVYELKGGQAGGQHRRNSSDSFEAFDGFE